MKLERLHRVAMRVAGLSHNLRVGGLVEFRKDTGPVRRDIRVHGFEWQSDSLRNLAKILWAAQRAHSYAMASLRLFSKMPSSEFSPDGLLGGRGYIQSIKDMRSGLGQAVEVLSTFTDTVHDEVNADHWNTSADSDTADIMQNAEEVKANPEGFVQQEFSEEDGEFENPSPEEMNPGVNEDSEGDEEDEEGQDQFHLSAEKQTRPKEKKLEPGAMLPSDDPAEQKEGKTLSETTMHTVTPDHGSYAASILKFIKGAVSHTASLRQADSSIPVETLPGPRVDHIGPAGGNEAGHYNDENVWPSDDPCGEGLHSGVNDSEYLYEGTDANGDGTTGYDNPTEGDYTALKVTSKKVSSNYSWLPGTSNEKNLNYYDLGLTTEDVEWMKTHNEPDPPKDMQPKPRHQFDQLWDPELIW